eukprot:2963677-Amphidinium_carterae.1
MKQVVAALSDKKRFLRAKRIEKSRDQAQVVAEGASKLVEEQQCDQSQSVTVTPNESILEQPVEAIVPDEANDVATPSGL